jgi:hypothetical protein
LITVVDRSGRSATLQIITWKRLSANPAASPITRLGRRPQRSVGGRSEPFVPSPYTLDRCGGANRTSRPVSSVGSLHLRHFTIGLSFKRHDIKGQQQSRQSQRVQTRCPPSVAIANRAATTQRQRHGVAVMGRLGGRGLGLRWRYQLPSSGD